jgi:diguanylate cyclase (GGDEF)-like protein
MAAPPSAEHSNEIQVASQRYLAARRRLLQLGLLFSLVYWLLLGWSLQQSWSGRLESARESAMQASKRVTERLDLSLDLATAVFATTDITLEQVPDPYTVRLIVKPMATAALHMFDSVVFSDSQHERNLAIRPEYVAAAAAELPPCPAPPADLPAGQMQLGGSANLLFIRYKLQHGWTPELWLCAKLVQAELAAQLKAIVGDSGLDLLLVDLTDARLIAGTTKLELSMAELQGLREHAQLQGPLPAGQHFSAQSWLVLSGDNWLQGRQLLLSQLHEYPLQVVVQVTNRALLFNWFAQIKWLLPISLVLMLLLVLAYIGSLRFIQAMDFAATHDVLTQLYNRRHFLEIAQQVQLMARRSRQVYSLILLDIDHFKSVNDRFGHAAGDAVLQGVAACLARAGRQSDLLGRYGGEEFVLVLPATTQEGASLAAEHLRLAVAEHAFRVNDQPLSVTISLGYISDDGSQRLEDLLNAADQALYQAKASGRNRALAASALGWADQSS